MIPKALSSFNVLVGGWGKKGLHNKKSKMTSLTSKSLKSR